MPETTRRPNITIGICTTAERGVAVASYSGHHSRMWAWDAETLEILGHQDVKAAVTLLDISQDGRYCAYVADAKHKDEEYIAICRPPYFHALWLQTAFHLDFREVVFASGNTVRYYCSTSTATGAWIKDAITPDSPFKFELMELEAQRSYWKERARTRCSGVIETSINPGLAGKKFDPKSVVATHERDLWTGSDGLGRKISVDGERVLADGEPFLNCQRTPFEAISPPNWAEEW